MEVFSRRRLVELPEQWQRIYGTNMNQYQWRGPVYNGSWQSYTHPAPPTWTISQNPLMQQSSTKLSALESEDEHLVLMG
jgi:hypothetical protein